MSEIRAAKGSIVDAHLKEAIMAIRFHLVCDCGAVATTGRYGVVCCAQCAANIDDYNNGADNSGGNAWLSASDFAIYQDCEACGEATATTSRHGLPCCAQCAALSDELDHDCEACGEATATTSRHGLPCCAQCAAISDELDHDCAACGAVATTTRHEVTCCAQCAAISDMIDAAAADEQIRLRADLQ